MEIKFDIMILLPNGKKAASHIGCKYSLDTDDFFEIEKEALKWAKEQMVTAVEITNIELLSHPDELVLISDTMEHTMENFDGSDHGGTEEGVINFNEDLQSDGYYIPVIFKGEERWIVNPNY